MNSQPQKQKPKTAKTSPIRMGRTRGAMIQGYKAESTGQDVTKRRAISMKLSKVLTILTPLMLVVGAVWAANEVMSADHPLKIMCQAMMTTALSVGAIGLVVWAGLYSLSAVFRYIGRHFDPIECNTNKS